MAVWCGIDWAERHHDVALVDETGRLLARRRIDSGPVGFAELLELLAEHRVPEEPVTVAIETARGLLPAALVAAGIQVFAINPLSVARYRDRHAVSGGKSDRADALVLANILRTDGHAHRPVPADSEQALEVRVLARAHQDAIWDRQQVVNRLRALLLEYYPAAVDTFPDLASPVARQVLMLAPTPTQGALLRRPALKAALVRAGRQRSIAAEVERIHAALRTEQLQQLPAVERAMGSRAQGLLESLEAVARTADRLRDEVTAAFETHPDAELITSLPGLGSILGARVLAEIGDDRSRFADARGLKAYAGSAPITRASGKTRRVQSRLVRNRRLADAGDRWALCLLTASPGARAHYDRRREQGDTHAMAARQLSNRYFGILFHLLQTGAAYDELKAHPSTTLTPTPAGSAAVTAA